MLEQVTVDEQEEALRQRINRLSDADRQQFFTRVKKEIKDPDTYATLNWFFVTGLHHFYLGKWLQGAFDLSAFVVGILLIVYDQVILGVALIVLVTVAELWALFRSQIIVQDWNNRIYAATLREFE
jgi:TM2 domain-containing membrane protein YozV